MQFTLPPRSRPIHKGASGHVLRLLEESAVNGVCLISFEAMAHLTGYCPVTIQKSIRRLLAANIIEVDKVYGDRRNCYRLRGHDVSQTPT